MDILNKISQLTKDNGAVRNLRELLKEQVFAMPAFEQFFTTVANAQQGEKLGWLGQMENVGWAADKTCNPTYRKLAQDFAEKEWDLGRWSVPAEWCADDFMGTIAEYALKEGTDVADLTGTDILDVVIYPALQDAFFKMYHRIVWFGDKSANNVGSGGNISAGVDKTLFTMTDGLWKRLFAVAAANAKQRTSIEANTEASASAQKSSLYAEGAAIAIFEDIIMNADSRIAGLPNAAIYCTDSLAKALSRDLMKVYKQQLSWQQVESGVEGATLNGVRTTEFEGFKILSMDMWDRMILEFESNGTKLNLPHRAFYGSPSQLLVGTPANQIMSDISIFYDQKSRTVHEYAEGRLGTLIGQDELFHIAY